MGLRREHIPQLIRFDIKSELLYIFTQVANIERCTPGNADEDARPSVFRDFRYSMKYEELVDQCEQHLNKFSVVAMLSVPTALAPMDYSAIKIGAGVVLVAEAVRQTNKYAQLKRELKAVQRVLSFFNKTDTNSP